MAEQLSDAEIADRLPDGWAREGDEIARSYEFDEYLDGIAFVVDVGELADEAFHHPELVVGFREVEVRLTTHDAGGITENDIELAEEIDRL